MQDARNENVNPSQNTIIISHPSSLSQVANISAKLFGKPIIVIIRENIMRIAMRKH